MKLASFIPAKAKWVFNAKLEMFHFFPRFARNVDETPFATELRRLGVPNRLFAEEVNRHYSSRLGLIFRVYPALFLCALRAAIRSLLLARPKPSVVVITSDIEALVFGIAKILFSRKTRIAFETFIITERNSGWVKRLHRFYYTIVLWFVDVAICHSESEVRKYALEFPNASFVAILYALSVSGRGQLYETHKEAAAQSNVVVTAGRSGRDYTTLARAVVGLPIKLRVICDWKQATQVLENLEETTLLRECFKADLLAELAQARMVVIPISQQHASAGQMVLLQAFALGKPVIVTDTITIREYVVDNYDALLVNFGDPADLRKKILFLLKDATTCISLGERAFAQYNAKFSTEAYVRRLIPILQNISANSSDLV